MATETSFVVAGMTCDHCVSSVTDELRALPGVGDYTAAAIASFAFGQRHVVLDTNVRRLFARAAQGLEYPADSITASERQVATDLLPERDAHRWAAATMELGAVICTARSPRCDTCPIDDCTLVTAPVVSRATSATVIRLCVT